MKAELREARAELAKFKRYLGTTAFLQTGPRARVLPDGTAVAPDDAPEPVKRVIQAGNAIAKFPYKWGGGHGAWRDNGYDCSGSVSFALAGAGLLGAPLTSGDFIGWGDPGAGEWITIYTNPGHIFMIVAGLRFDTSGAGRAGHPLADGAALDRRLHGPPPAGPLAGERGLQRVRCCYGRASVNDDPTRILGPDDGGRGPQRPDDDPSTCGGGSWRRWRRRSS